MKKIFVRLTACILLASFLCSASFADDFPAASLLYNYASWAQYFGVEDLKTEFRSGSTIFGPYLGMDDLDVQYDPGTLKILFSSLLFLDMAKGKEQANNQTMKMFALFFALEYGEKPADKRQLSLDADQSIADMMTNGSNIAYSLGKLDENKQEKLRSGEVIELYKTEKYTYSILFVDGTGIFLYAQ